jgi:1-acyl-sn-glycerol-3-phosphate acyltransferase
VVYDFVAALLRPIAWWGRLRVAGHDQVPRVGPLLVVPNYDSQWDPVPSGSRSSPVGGCASSPGLASGGFPASVCCSTRSTQIPIRRGVGDARALEKAVEALNAGQSVCAFPEGGLSSGERLRARSGIGRLAEACPRAGVVLCAVEGCTEYDRFPPAPASG